MVKATFESIKKFLTELTYNDSDDSSSHIPHFHLLKLFNSLIKEDTDTNKKILLGNIYLMYWLIKIEYRVLSPQNSKLFCMLENFLNDNECSLSFEQSIIYIAEFHQFNQNHRNNGAKTFLNQIESAYQNKGYPSWFKAWKPTDDSHLQPIVRVCEYLFKQSETARAETTKALRESEMHQNFTEFVKKYKKAKENSYTGLQIEETNFIDYICEQLEKDKESKAVFVNQELTEDTIKSMILTYNLQVGICLHFLSEILKDYSFPAIWAAKDHSERAKLYLDMLGKEPRLFTDAAQRDAIFALYQYLDNCIRNMDPKKERTPGELAVLKYFPKIAEKVVELAKKPIKQDNSYAEVAREDTKLVVEFFWNSAVYDWVSNFAPNLSKEGAVVGAVVGQVLFTPAGPIFSQAGVALGSFAGSALGKNFPSFISSYWIARLAPLGKMLGETMAAPIKLIVSAVEGGYRLTVETFNAKVHEKVKEELQKLNMEEFLNALIKLPPLPKIFPQEAQMRLERTHVLNKIMKA